MPAGCDVSLSGWQSAGLSAHDADDHVHGWNSATGVCLLGEAREQVNDRAPASPCLHHGDMMAPVSDFKGQ